MIDPAEGKTNQQFCILSGMLQAEISSYVCAQYYF